MSNVLLFVHVLSIYFAYSDARCCQTKIVGDEIFTFVARRDQIFGNCRNGCTYRKNDSNSLFCFAAGKKVAECQEGIDDGHSHCEAWILIKTVQCTIGKRKTQLNVNNFLVTRNLKRVDNAYKVCRLSFSSHFDVYQGYENIKLLTIFP